MAKTTAKKRPFVQIVGCVAGNLASSVLATRFTPEAGVGLAIMALACWLFSFYPAEKWIKERFREAPVNSSVAVLFFLGLLTFTGVQSARVYQRERSVIVSSGKQGGCTNSGPATANGQGSIANSGCANSGFSTGVSGSQ